MKVTSCFAAMIVTMTSVVAIAQEAVFVDVLASGGDGAGIRAYAVDGAPAGIVVEAHAKTFNPVVILLAPDGRATVFRDNQRGDGAMGAPVGGVSVTIPEGFGPDWILAVAPSHPDGEGAFALVTENPLPIIAISGPLREAARRRALLAIEGRALAAPLASRRAIREVQAALNDLSFNAGAVDGLLGRQTRKALSAYQESIGAPVTGALTAAQRDALLTARILQAQREAPTGEAVLAAAQSATSSALATASARSPSFHAESAGIDSSSLGKRAAVPGSPGAARPAERSGDLPAMKPWAPPRPSDRGTVDRARLAAALGDLPRTLGGVGDYLRSELASAGYSDAVYLGVPGGFAIMTRIEQIDDLGAPLPGADRYSEVIAWDATPFWHLWELFLALIKAPEGYFRTLTLIVTDQPFSPSGQAAESATFDNWWAEAVSALPVDVRSKPFTDGHEVSVLVYRFTKTEHDAPPEFINDRSLPVKEQLRHVRLSALML